MEQKLENSLQNFKTPPLTIQQLLIYKNIPTTSNNKKIYSINFYFEILEYPQPYSLDSYSFEI